MTTTATGILSIPLDSVRQMVANSTTFQTWTGVANATDALAYIFLIAPDASGSYPNPVASQPRPCAVINMDYCQRDLKAAGFSPLYSPSNKILLKFEAKNTTGHKNKGADPAITFLNAIGGIVTDLEAQQQGLQILNIDIEAPERKKESFTGEQGDFYEIELKLSTGYR